MGDNLALASRFRGNLRFVFLALIAGSLAWAHLPTFTQLVSRWWNDPLYSHGFFVPGFALFLLWFRQSQLVREQLRMNYWGLPMILAGELFVVAGNYFYLDDVENLSLLITLTGVVVLLGGWAALRWSWPAIGYLFFMMPLPYRVETALAFPLRLLATNTGCYVAQTVGFAALVEETTNIRMGEEVIKVAPECSGIGMLLVFFALSTAIVLVIERPFVDKIAIVLSAVPIAIIANIVRITLTAFLYQVATTQVARKFFHDWAGLFMMVVGLALLYLELWFLDHLFVAAKARAPMQLGLAGTKTVRTAPRLQHAKAPPDTVPDTVAGTGTGTATKSFETVSKGGLSPS